MIFMFSATIITYLQLRQRAFLHRTNMPKKQFQMVKLLPKKLKVGRKKLYKIEPRSDPRTSRSDNVFSKNGDGRCHEKYRYTGNIGNVSLTS